MKRLVWLVPVILTILLCASAQASDIPAWEVSGGYSYLRANLGGSTFSLNGGTTTLSENLNNWFGGRIEASFYQESVFGRTVSAQTYTYGPVFAYRRYDKITPFVHVQLGAVHASKGYLGISQPAFKFAASGGAGVDLKINQKAALRLQADYLMTRFLALRQDNLQASVALVIRFGKK